jgi:uncharacterized protein YndB with AHSA1/START domain
MGPVSASTTIDSPREAVFSFISDLANRPAFTDHFIREFRLARLRSAGAGASARFRLEPGDAPIWAETVIDSVDPPHLILESGRGGRNGRIPIRTSWELLQGPGPLTTVTVGFATEPTHPLDRVRELRPGAERRMRRHWAKAMRRLRDLIESDAEVPRARTAGAPQ